MAPTAGLPAPTPAAPPPPEQPRGAAGPTPGQLLRSVPRIMADPLAYLERAAATWGDMVAFDIEPRAALLVNDPDGVDHVLRRNAGGYGKHTLQYDSLSLLTGQGLLTAETEPWRERRRQLAPGFHRRTLAALVTTVDAAAGRMGDALAAATARAGGARAVAVEEPVLAGTLDVVAGALFGADLGAGSSRVAHAVVRGLDGVIGRATTPLRLPLRYPTPANRRLTTSLRELDDLVAGLVEERRAAGPPAAAAPGAPGGDDRAPDLLDLLLAHLEDPRAVRDEVVTLVVAGHETVASALVWALWLLAAHPGEAAAVAAEARAVLGDGPATVEAVGRLTRARAVLDETLRLYPPSWVVTRRALADDVVAGVPVAAGTLVIISPWTLHRRAAAWPDPDVFDPARFRRAPGAPDPTRRADYVPFGAGPRLCIGRDFALVEATLVLARLLDRFELAVPTSRAPRPRARVTVRPRRGVRLHVRLRVRPSAG